MADSQYTNVPPSSGNNNNPYLQGGQNNGQTSDYQASSMGAPAYPGSHPGTPQSGTSDYVQTTPVKQGMVGQLTGHVHKAEGFMGGLWGHLTAGPSVAGTAVGKLNNLKLWNPQAAEKSWRETFHPAPNDVFKNYFTCHLSTTTGAVPGTLFISTNTVSFSSDRPLQFTSAPGKIVSSFYNVNLPLNRVSSVTKTHNKSRPQEKYIQLSTVDNHQFWFMGFLSYEKAVETIESVSREAKISFQNDNSLQNSPQGQSGFNPNQNPNQVPNQQPNQNLNQNSSLVPNQNSNQISSQNPNQYPNQYPNQMTHESEGKTPQLQSQT